MMRYLDEQIDRIQDVIDKNNKPIPFEILDDWRKREWSFRVRGIDKDGDMEPEYNEHPFYFYEYGEETIDKMRDAIRSIRITKEYLRHVDKLLGDDIGEDDFIDGLISNLKDIY